MERSSSNSNLMAMSQTAPLTLTVYCDGACKGNPGPGGWGVQMQWPDGAIAEYCGHDAQTTNNRMELKAAAMAVKLAPAGSHLIIWTDSSYVQQGITSWLTGWKQRQWRKADGKPVFNEDLWRELDQAVISFKAQGGQIDWHWIKGHDGHAGNEAADALANRGAAGETLLPEQKEHKMQANQTQVATPINATELQVAMHPAIRVTTAEIKAQGERQLVLDTETTGLDARQGDRLIEIGLVELIGRKLTGVSWHVYLNPQRPVGESFKVHGLEDAFLADQPLFHEVVTHLLEFIGDSDLIAHNSGFDMAFLDYELRQHGHPPLTERVRVIDSLQLAKRRFPGQKNSLDALVKRFTVRQRERTYHGALLDAQILADVYLAMTGGQVSLQMSQQEQGQVEHRRIKGRKPRGVMGLSLQEQAAHEQYLAGLDNALWKTLA